MEENDIKDSRDELSLPVHRLESMQMGDGENHMILIRDGKELKCPFSTRIMMPVGPESSIQTAENKGMQYGIAETPCGDHCAKFGLMPHKVKKTEAGGKEIEVETGGIVAVLSCGRGKTMYISNKRLPEKKEATVVEMTKEEKDQK